MVDGSNNSPHLSSAFPPVQGKNTDVFFYQQKEKK